MKYLYEPPLTTVSVLTAESRYLNITSVPGATIQGAEEEEWEIF